MARTPGVTLSAVKSGDLLPSKRPRDTEDNADFAIKRKKKNHPKPADNRVKVNSVLSALPERSIVLGIISSVSAKTMTADLLSGYRGLIQNPSSVFDDQELIEGVDLRKYYSLGDFIVGIVTGIPANPRSQEVTLSLRPSVINSRSFVWPPSKNQVVAVTLTSQEEHGYLASTGDSKVRIFVRTEYPKFEATYSKGTVHYVTVDSIKREAKLIICHGDDSVRYRYLGRMEAAEVGSLMPGQLVDAVVIDLLKHGGSKKEEHPIMLPWVPKKNAATCLSRLSFNPEISALEMSFASSLGGVVTKSHIHNPISDSPEPAKNLAQFYPFRDRDEESPLEKTSPPYNAPEISHGQQTLARIIAVVPEPSLPGNRKIFLTLLPHLVHLDKSAMVTKNLIHHVKRGKLIESARILEGTYAHGLKLLSSFETVTENNDIAPVKQIDFNLRQVLSTWKMPPETTFLVRCKQDKLSDTVPLEVYLLRLSVGQKQPCRIINVRLLDAIATGATSEEYLADNFMDLDNVCVGDRVSGIVQKKFEHGVLVELSKRCRVILPKEQMLDTSVLDMPDIYSMPGSPVTGRILSVDQVTRQIQLTCKKSLMKESDLSKYTDPEKHLKINDIIQGYVKFVTVRALGIKSFGSFVGFLDITDIANTLKGSRHVIDLSESERKTILADRNYRIGASIRCRVEAMHIREGKQLAIYLSLNLDAKSPDSNDRRHNAFDPSVPTRLAPLNVRTKSGYALPEGIIQDIDPSLWAANALNLLPVGTEIDGFVAATNSLELGYEVSVWGKLRVLLHATEVGDLVAGEFPLKKYKLKDKVLLRITGICGNLERMTNNKLCLLEGTMRTVTNPSLSPKTLEELQVGNKYFGVVINASTKGVFIALSSKLTVRVKLCEVPQLDDTHADKSTEAIREIFPDGIVVENVRIKSVSFGRGQVEASLKVNPFELILDDPDKLVTLKNISIGDMLPARVKKIADFGVFVTFENSDLDGLCYLQDTDHDIQLAVGDLVLSRVTRLDKAKGRIGVGLKSSLFSDADLAKAEKTMMADKEDVDNEAELTVVDDVSSDESTAADQTSDSEDRVVVEAGISDEDIVDISDTEEISKPEQRISKHKVSPAEKLISFGDILEKVRSSSANKGKWSGLENAGMNVLLDDKHLLAEEEKTRSLEARYLNADWEQNPESVDELERLILIKGTESADVWIKYMAYHVQMGNLAAARLIAERGMRQIVLEKDVERQSLQLGWINLEEGYGSKEECIKVIQSAFQRCDPVSVFLHVVELLESNGKWEMLEEVAKFGLKKCGRDVTCWTRYLVAMYVHMGRENRPDLRKDIDDIVKRGCSILETRDGLVLMTTAARLEFKFGACELGRVKFMAILREKPSRLDIWVLLLDSQIAAIRRKRNKAEMKVCRGLFESCLSSLSPKKRKKAKNIFKKWLEFEKEFGNADTVAKCKDKARDFVKASCILHQEESNNKV